MLSRRAKYKKDTKDGRLELNLTQLNWVVSSGHVGTSNSSENKGESCNWLYYCKHTLPSDIIIYLQSECIEKYQFELCSKYGREHDLDVTLGQVLSCRKLRWICRKNSNDFMRQVEIPGKSTIFVARQIGIIFISCQRLHYTTAVKHLDTAKDTYLV